MRAANAEGENCKRRRVEQNDTPSLEVDAALKVRDALIQPNAGRSNIIDSEVIFKNSGIFSTRNVNSSSSMSQTQKSHSDATFKLSNTNDCVRPSLSSIQANLVSSPISAVTNLMAPLPARLASDALASHVPSLVKQHICRGEYINLALLLKGAVELSELCSGAVLRLSSDSKIEISKECKDKISSIQRWTDAFIIYTSIYL